MSGPSSSDPTPPFVHPAGKPAGGLSSVLATVRQLVRDRAVRRGTKALRVINQVEGFDCPGCAWPEAKERSTFEFCENGAKAVAAETTSRRAGPDFFAKHTVADLLAQSDYWLEQQGRLTHPLIRRAGSDRFEPIEWDEAFARAGEVLRSLKDPNQAAFYTSGRTSNEAAFLYQLFGRMYGTNNFPDCSNLCHESSGVGLRGTLGVGKGTVQLDDFTRADAIFVIGQNPGTNHPRMLSALQAARRRGAEIVAINPLRERGLEEFIHPQEVAASLTGHATRMTTLYLQPKPGSDVAVLKGMMKRVLEAEKQAPGRVLDHGFIRAHTTGVEALVADLAATSWEAIEEQTGLARGEIIAAADVYIRSRASIVTWAMGLTQHDNAVDNVMAIADLLLLRGNVGRPGAGACPVRGHSNVQGDRTVGIDHAPGAPLLDRLEEVFGFRVPREHGLDVVETIRAMDAGRIRFFMAMGGNFFSASPDHGLLERAMRTPELSVYVLTKLNRGALVHGREAMIWPCLGRTERDAQAGGEQFVTVEDSMSVVHASRGHNRPASPHLRSEPAIVAGLAKATLPPSGTLDWDALVADYDRVRDLIEKTIPGFEDYNRRVREPGGFVLRNTAAHREWKTQSGLAQFTVVPTPDIHLPDGQLRLFTIRSHDQYNTTIYGLDDRYRGIKGARRVVLMHAADLAERGIRPGDEVDIRSHYTDGVERLAPRFRAVAYDVPRGCCAAYFPEANVLVPLGKTARLSNQPSSKLVPVTIALATSPVRTEGRDERLVFTAAPDAADEPVPAAV
ncbi:MAG TPA: FdhF/YdeP family oxidoreductase [Longimicrobiaceae bacterium]|nr:FdhF/YdeP family oxidoreductase [Longimicrobiaceae bacterium]